MKDRQTVDRKSCLVALLILASCVLMGNRTNAMSSTASSDADYRTPELIALAAGLKNDRESIFKWVRENIRYVQYYGCKKGAYLTYLERSGNDADQSALLVALWRAAGISCQYVWGWGELPISAANNVDWYHYLGADGVQDVGNGNTSLDQLVWLRGEPTYGWWDGSFLANSKGMARVWVQTNVNGTLKSYDPSFKLIQPVAGLAVASLMNYNRASLLSSLGAGTTGTNSITGLSYSGLSAYLSGCAAQFITTYQNSHFNKTVDEIVGGWKPLSSESLTFPITSVMTTNDLLDNLSTTTTGGQTVYVGYASIKIQVFLSSDTGHTSPIVTWGAVNMASLRGRRLGLVSESNKVTLKLDDTQIVQAASTTTVGTPLDIVVDITHAGSPYINPAFNLIGKVMKAKAGASYALVYGFDVSSDYLNTRQQQLASYKEQGLGDQDPKMILETLNIIGLQWMLETDSAHGLIGNLKNLSSTFLYRFGRAAQEPTTSGNAVYVDLPFNYTGYVSRVPDTGAANTLTAESAYSFIMSAMEHGVLDQMQAVTAVSTVKVLKMANEQSIPIFLANPGNWSSVRSQLIPLINIFSPYGAGDLAQLDGAISEGASILLPKNGHITQSGWAWNGSAYAAILWNAVGSSYWKMIIGQTYNGGFSTLPNVQTNPSSVLTQSHAQANLFQKNPVTLKVSYGLDPVNLATGNFTHQRELLTAGDGLVRGLNFSVSYDGGDRLKNDAKIGYGWTHSYYVRAVEMADVDGAFGKKTPIEMAATLAGVVAALDVFANRTTVKDWLGTALIANWMVDQLTGSAVSIVSGNQIWQFHKQADGSYSAPPGATQVLTKPANYQLVERNGPTWKFDANKRLSEIEDLWGKKLTLNYNTNGDLGTVADAYGRTLTFNYIGSGAAAVLNTVADNSSRSVTFTIDSSKNLTAFTDPEGKSDNFEYVSGHLIANYKNHDGNVVVSNVYDAQGRVATQDTMGDPAQRWHLYYSPGQTIEQEPGGASTLHFFDGRNREVEVDNAFGHRLLTTYDAQDRIRKKERIVETTVDETMLYDYDNNHNLTVETDPKGKTTVYAYDGSNQLTSVKDKRGNYTYYQNYNAQHQPQQITDRENRVVTCTYKPPADPGAGYLASVTEGGFTTSYGYDAKGALNSITYPGGAGESMVNNAFGDPATRTDELTRQTLIEYNLRREVTSTTTPGSSSGSRTSYMSYDNKRDLLGIWNPRGYATFTFQTVTHKPGQTTLPDGSVAWSLYDINDRVQWTATLLTLWTHHTRDTLGRETALTDPIGRTTTTIFQDDLRKTIVQSPSPLNIQTKATVDERGQVVRDEDGLGNYATPGYDDNGNKTTWIDRRGKTWSFVYDKEDRLITTTSPLSRATQSPYNARGLLDHITEPSTQVTTFGYDGRRRLTSRADAVGTINYGLDNASQLLTVTQGAAVLARTYYGSGEVATYKNANNETTGYDYDKDGNLTSLTYPAVGSVPSATVTYTYDNRDRLTSMTDWAGRITTYSWDAEGKLTGVTRPNGTKRRLSWDWAGEMLAVEERPASGAPLAVRSFHYDAAGRIDKRLIYPQATAWAEPAWTAVPDNDNRLTSVAGATLSYDADGNLQGSRLPDGPWGSSGTSSGVSGTFTWNARNQLTGVVRTGGQTAGYTYDAEGNLIQTVDSVAGTTRWIIDPNGGESPRILAKVAPNGNVTRYVYGVGLVYEVRQDGSVRYYHYDQVGSTVALTDGTGAVTGRADYSPYGTLQSTSGELANANATPFLFVGAYGVMTDSVTGLHQMRARWYSSYLRRFLNEDPSRFAGGENFYAYASGNPISLVDPSGLWGVQFGEDGMNIGKGDPTLVFTARGTSNAYGSVLSSIADTLTLSGGRLSAANENFRSGGREPINVNPNTLDFSQLKPGQKFYTFPITSPGDFVVHGTVLVNPSTMSVRDDYDFDLKPWTLKTAVRNTETIAAHFIADPLDAFTDFSGRRTGSANKSGNGAFPFNFTSSISSVGSKSSGSIWK